MNEAAAMEILACNDRNDLKKLLAKWKQQSLHARIKPDPAFATSPICVTDKDYEFSIDPDIITLVESDPFYGVESKTVMAHLTKLNDIATLFTNDKSRYLYILKIFLFSLKGDAKTRYNSLAPGCVRSVVVLSLIVERGVGKERQDLNYGEDVHTRFTSSGPSRRK